MSNLPFGLLVDVFLIVGALFAIWKGGAPERTAAAVVLLNVAIGRSTSWWMVENRDLIWLCNDGLAALILLFVTVRFAAPWMGGMMLFFAAQFTLLAYYMVTMQPTFDYTYSLINNINWSGITWCLILGTAMAWRGRMRARRLAAAT
ncbi:hypothetical protein [Phenylobacterium sp. J367]|uniref:hypothetical protein n=1 Tax=Phenylobacterium sp. J367 TaxID=2898435 RepID=UPI002151E29B|nr:hypothetical protein [Phenylobacterium sp. J367]MCR5877957.1 hypothetical protein [Phenylobacterium sp. J367]